MNKNRYHSLNTYFRKTFGEKVYKVSIAGGFTCPTRDGSRGTEGCVFCNPAGSEPKHYQPGMTITKQLELATEYVRERHETDHFLAYFQDYTTTYKDVKSLKKMYREALNFPGIRGLSLCTRPDCISEDVMDLLKDLSQETFVWVELGIQSGCDVTLLRMNRGHTVYDSETAFEKLHKRNIRTAAHVILGFPGESRKETLTTAKLVNKSGTAGVKLQNLHIIKDTQLAEQYKKGEFEPMRRSEYAGLAADFIERTRPDIVIQRVTGEAPPRMLVAPEWAINKLAVMNRVKRELMYRDSWQGRLLGYTMEDIPSL
ncbi:MAG: TIGR01212 family radical SAM protein [Candidatus Sabulitectum sp.]|nr:TIGR01212 family radical SAM protein [Candidatus Sabulitectum sp.]